MGCLGDIKNVMGTCYNTHTPNHIHIYMYARLFSRESNNNGLDSFSMDIRRLCGINVWRLPVIKRKPYIEA